MTHRTNAGYNQRGSGHGDYHSNSVHRGSYQRVGSTQGRDWQQHKRDPRVPTPPSQGQPESWRHLPPTAVEHGRNTLTELQARVVFFKFGMIAQLHQPSLPAASSPIAAQPLAITKG
jgi:hypothetical protein